ncbi:hypothetical protein BKA61DRAFT_631861 [Leptodontidium sp. MPI-SDFR-AT-0119]|nr:hypothetical protein BKA61DRAFT_631861 [Leptodontidium sp. MPI-SDFR-AT-0119]
MRFSILTLALTSGLAVALPYVDSTSGPSAASLSGAKLNDRDAIAEVNAESEERLVKRGATAVVIGIAAVKGAAILTKIAIEHGAETIKNLGKWTEVREAFTKATVADMWSRNPDRNKWHAAICYNKGYRVQNPNGIDGKLSAKVSSGLLNTDYDCMYMNAPNQFYTDGDGGYINLAYQYDSHCTFDKKSGDLTCK